jgi:hypothetical protein
LTFLNPFAWIAAVAAGIPLLIHLLSRRQARREMFPAIRFLRQVHRQEVRRIRLREWLLLLLRTLAVVCLMLAFSRPALQGTHGNSSHSPTSMLALIDRSLSMRANGPKGSRFEEARSRISEVGALMEPGSEIQAVGFESKPAPLFEDFTHDPARFKTLTRGLQPGYGATDIAAAVREGARWLRGRPGLHRELFVVSDFQAAGLDSAAARTLAEDTKGLEVYLVPVGSQGAQNAAWISAEAARVGAGGQVTGVIRNTSDEARKGALIEAAQGDRLLGAARADLPAHSDTRVTVALQGLGATDFGTMLRFPHDALEEDDHISVAFPSSKPMRVALVGPEDQRLYVEAALKAAPGAYEIQTSEDGSSLQAAEVWLLLDPQHVNAASLRAHLASGGGVLAVAGENAARGLLEQALGDAAPGVVNNGAGQYLGGSGASGAATGAATGPGARGAAPDTSPTAFARLRVLEPGSPVFHGLADRRGGELSSARFLRHLRVRATAGATTLAEFSPDEPAILERGHVMELTSSLDGRWNDFPLSPTFVPWLYQTLDVLASRALPVPVEVGSRWVRPLPPEWKGLPLALLSPDGRTVPVDFVQGGSALRTDPLMTPGLYTLEVSGKPAEAVAATVPVAEADLREAPRDLLQKLLPAAHLIQGSVREEVQRRRFGRELWREFLIAALLLLALETLVARLTVARSS